MTTNKLKMAARAGGSSGGGGRVGLGPAALILCSVLAAAGAASDAFDAVLGDTSSCQKACGLTYSLHTYPKEEELYACQRGCRLFSICQFVDDGGDLNRTRKECESACAEAYSQQDEQFACNFGCDNQLPFAEQQQKLLLSMVPKIHFLYPVSLMSAFCSDLMNSAQSFFTSWTFYLQTDDGKVLVFQSEPDIQFMVPQFELQADSGKEISQALSVADHIAKAIYDDTQKAFRHEHEDGSYSDLALEQESQSILECLSRNAGIPRWILTTMLVLSVLVQLWICCATAATAVEQHVPAEKLSIYGDLEFMNDLKLAPYPASSLIVIKSSDEAGPLPPKVSLSHSPV
ncbi:transmembrane protein 59 [Callorhinchus milii]|uniref:Transmembrane protein 59 n=1 Tax=Callorhinchus milii TaxID=7868 RepID=K4FS30_CALMI|nr:transmembrane protein 59 [Callorhinchus milii]AFK10803.1 transmembrane protein 59-like isoform 1 [Callorhinchus milii]